MSRVRSAMDRFAVALTAGVLRVRLIIVFLTLGGVLALGFGAGRLEFASNYRVFFSDANPELAAFEKFQNDYTKTDNILFVLTPRSGDAFDAPTLRAVQELTEAAWRLPYAQRVDSITNFQHTYAAGDSGDELIVEDLIQDVDALSAADRARKRAIALAEPLLRDQLISADGAATAVNVVLQYPFVDPSEVNEAANAARDLRTAIEASHPDVDIVITGVSMLNNAFAEVGTSDLGKLAPIMFAVILALSALILRSISGTAATLVVIILSVVAAMGLAGFSGVKLTPISAMAPIVILTLAVADSIHILISFRGAMREGMAKRDALIEAMRVNFLAVSITSLTTVVGFLALNYSDAPPFRHLGNISAAGIAVAWALSITLLPALVSLLPMKAAAAAPASTRRAGMFAGLAEFVIARPRAVALLAGGAAIILTAMIPRISFNDQWVKYFDTSVEFRRHADAAAEHFGLYPIEFSAPAGEPGGVSEPEFLAALDGFAQFMRTLPNVTHVYSLADIMKRLNKNLHADDEAYYRLPEDRELSAQYLLLYELSLPYGLDLNDRITVDKSASRVTVTLGAVSTAESKEILAAADRWWRENAPDYYAAPTGPQVMFTYITDRNIESMILGTAIAVGAISLIMMASLRSVGLGLLSLIPNALPILAAFGAWALIIGEVGFSIATVASISLGIVVDDTVHFLTKFMRARRERGLSPAESVRYAFDNVGLAIAANTLILTAGFLVLMASSFKINVDLGLLTGLAIVFALILDFLLLPALLLIFSGARADEPRQGDRHASSLKHA